MLGSQQQQGSDRSQHFFRSKKRTGLGPHPLPGLGSETAVLDALTECVKANASQGSERSQHLFRPKKRTGLGPHPCPQIRGVSKDFGGYVRSSDVTPLGETGDCQIAQSRRSSPACEVPLTRGPFCIRLVLYVMEAAAVAGCSLSHPTLWRPDCDAFDLRYTGIGTQDLVREDQCQVLACRAGIS